MQRYRIHRSKRPRYAQFLIVPLLGLAVVMGFVLQGAPVAQATPASAPLRAGRPGGDIPDSAVYLRYSGKGFTIEYVEGWLQTTIAHGISFTDKDSAATVEIAPRSTTVLSTYVQRVDLPRLAHSDGFVKGTVSTDVIAGYRAMRLRFRSRSAPDAVTGKMVVLQSDRYYIAGPHALALITLSTPLGVDNVDGFYRIAHSFRFR